MKISDFLGKDRMMLELRSSDKDSLIKELAGCMKDAPGMKDFNGFVEDVFKREALASTAIGNNVAIPHARTDAVKKFILAFGRSKKGIECNSLDGKPVKLFFLMGTPREEDMSGYLKILARLTRFLTKESFRELLLNAADPATVIKTFILAEK